MLTSLLLFAFFAMALALSVASGSSILVYDAVSREKNPRGCWMAIGILALLTAATAAIGASDIRMVA